MERSTEPSVNSDFVAQQIRVVAAVTTAVYGVTRLLRIMRVPEAGTVTAGLGILGFIYASVRLTASSLQRLGLTASRRRQAQAELRGDLRALRERVQVGRFRNGTEVTRTARRQSSCRERSVS
ncbi:hypothetical protein Vretimale_2772 [Volvox reticuliferus]|uniref:Uncharacterized protein n=1 Tax=Volvox reticuliferus TaxID=1737510 RepID=A0A8J4FI86_9CHLO|nr:hypothetical protein Vretifemale_6870 [Volvox reticuliferus]GIL97288.1 hypothetical protein Vretimale_2772 [Volvox reticuliferus]